MNECRLILIKQILYTADLILIINMHMKADVRSADPADGLRRGWVTHQTGLFSLMSPLDKTQWSSVNTTSPIIFRHLQWKKNSVFEPISLSIPNVFQENGDDLPGKNLFEHYGMSVIRIDNPKTFIQCCDST